MGCQTLDIAFKCCDISDIGSVPSPFPDFTEPAEKPTCVITVPTTAQLDVQDGKVVSAVALTPSAPGQWQLGHNIEIDEPNTGTIDRTFIDQLGKQTWPDPGLSQLVVGEVKELADQGPGSHT